MRDAFRAFIRNNESTLNTPASRGGLNGEEAQGQNAEAHGDL
jgi:hypothetical protein